MLFKSWNKRLKLLMYPRGQNCAHLGDTILTIDFSCLYLQLLLVQIQVPSTNRGIFFRSKHYLTGSLKRHYIIYVIACPQLSSFSNISIHYLRPIKITQSEDLVELPIWFRNTLMKMQRRGHNHAKVVIPS